MSTLGVFKRGPVGLTGVSSSHMAAPAFHWGLVIDSSAFALGRAQFFMA